VVGVRALRPRAAQIVGGNPQAVLSIGLTERALAVLQYRAQGHADNHIAAAIDVLPNPVTTH